MNETAIPLLPGQIAFMLGVAALVAYPLARLLLWRYVRAVERAMRSATPSEASSRTGPPAAMSHAALTEPARGLLGRLQMGPWQAAAIQAGTGLLVALWFGALSLQAAQVGFSPFRVIVLAATHIWPGVLAVMLVAGISRRQRLAVLASGMALYLSFGVWAHTGSLWQALSEVATLWIVTNLAPTLYLAVFMTQRVRSVGPLILLVSLVTAGGVVTTFALLLQYPQANRAIAGVLLELGFGVNEVLVSFVLVGGGLAFLFGIWLLRRVADAYAHHWVGDQELSLAAMWLSFIVLYSVTLVFDGLSYFLLGLAAFPFYLLVTRLGQRLCLRVASTDPPPALLLLRVFSRKGPTAGLFRAISRHWRHEGPLRMIAGYDLAAQAIEPDEMMAFLRGRLADTFVSGPAVVQRRLTEHPPQRDPDSRFRSEEFFCFDNTWRDTLQRLVQDSAVILMDLRGFGPDNRGCLFELEALAESAAIPRTVVVLDATTPKPFLNDALTRLGIDPAALMMVQVRADEERDTSTLLRALAERVA